MIVACSHVTLTSTDVPRSMRFLETFLGIAPRYANAEFGEAKVRFLTRADPALLDRRLLIRYDERDYNILYVNTYGDEGKYMEFWCERITQEGKV